MAKDSNGYIESIMTTTDGECYICGRVCDTARHEIYGASNRTNSKAWGTWVALCPTCHERVHRRPKEYIWLKVAGQLQFEKLHGHIQFMSVYGRNYIEEERWTDSKQ